MKIPDKIPYMTGKYLPVGGYVEEIKMIDKAHPDWDEAVRMYLLIEEGIPDEVPDNRKVKKS